MREVDEKRDRGAAASTGAFFLSLHPNRSFSSSGFIVLMSLTTAASFFTGLYFWALGAWPIFGFFGLDVLLIYLAFRFSFRAARRFETIRITEDLVTITRVAPNGGEKVETFEAYWARTMIEKDRLWVTNRGRTYEIGSFLGEEEKLEVQELITTALHDYRTGGVFQSPSPRTSIIS